MTGTRSTEEEGEGRLSVGVLCLRGTEQPIHACPYYMRKELDIALGTTTVIGSRHRFPLLTKITRRRFGRVTPMVAAERAMRDLKLKPQDLLVGLYASEIIAVLPHAPCPVVYFSDGTAHDLVELYPQFNCLSESEKRAFLRAEELAVTRSDLIIVHSKWAAQSFIEKVGAAPEKVHVVPIGTDVKVVSQGFEPARFDPGSPIEVIFIGREWERKGLPASVRAIDELNARGVRAHLSIFGCVPPDGVLSENTTCYGPFDRSKPDEAKCLEEALIRAHVHLLPSLAECFGCSPGEAAYFYTPSIVTGVHGLPESVLDGVTGAVVSPLCEPEEIVKEIVKVIMSWSQSPDEYLKLCLAARRDAEARLSWKAWGQSVNRIIRDNLF
jgi:glycosyltransferase involved in cell wall biosynthesis